MKKLLLALTILLTVFLVGCDSATITTTETTTVEPTTLDLEQIMYDILVVEYATDSCDSEELQDYLYAYEKELGVESERIETLLNMIDDRLSGD